MTPFHSFATFSRRAGVVLAGLAIGLLAGCASPSRLPPGSTPDSTIAALGQPTGRYPLPNGGERLQYSLLPAGSQVWDIDFDTSGRLAAVDQVLRYGVFDSIALDRWTANDISLLFGKPTRIERVASFDGPIWTYRFMDMTNPRLIHIHIDPTGVVRRILYSDELVLRDFIR